MSNCSFCDYYLLPICFNCYILAGELTTFKHFWSQVVRDKRTGKTKGYGFVSFANPSDLAGALKEMNGN